VSKNDLYAILGSLQSTGFHDLSGARVSASIPVSERLINELVAASMPSHVPVREAHVHPEAGNRFAVRLTPKSAFLPSLTIKLVIERQPDLPGSPELVLRLASLGGLFGIAAGAFPIAQMLPPGVRLEGELIYVDLRAMAAQRGAADLVQYLRQLRVTTEDGRAILQMEASI
jgi:hypothetical protein